MFCHTAYEVSFFYKSMIERYEVMYSLNLTIYAGGVEDENVLLILRALLA